MTKAQSPCPTSIKCILKFCDFGTPGKIIAIIKKAIKNLLMRIFFMIKITNI